MKYRVAVLALVLVVSVVIVIGLWLSSSNGIRVRSAVNGKEYLVSGGSNAAVRADALARLDQLAYKLFSCNENREYVTRLRERYNFATLSENVLKADTSYTMNKKDVYVCLADRDTGAVYDDNLLSYVYLHELSHVACNSLGHSEEFYKIFGEILQDAERCGLYTPIDFTNVNYCGLKLV